MVEIVELETERLKLRQWRESDLPPFAALNADPQVMEYFPFVLTEQKSNALADKIRSLIAENGWGFWAVELKSEGRFIGLVGLNLCAQELPCAPAVEIGWRLAKEHWGCGYATEAARAALRFAFEQLELAEVVAFTAVGNWPSQAVMRRLNMRDIQQNFQHPMLPEGHPLREHVLYTLSRERWARSV